MSKDITYRLVHPGPAGTDRIATSLAGLQRLVPRYDADPDPQRRTAWQRTGERLWSALSFNGDTLVVKSGARTAPKVDSLIPIVEDGAAVSQDARRTAIRPQSPATRRSRPISSIWRKRSASSPCIWHVSCSRAASSPPRWTGSAPSTITGCR